MWENNAKQCRLRLFQDSDFAGDVEDPKSTSGGLLCIFGSHTFVPISWMCKKQTSVSRSSTKAGLLSLSTQVYAWMEFPPSIFGTESLEYFIPYRTKPTNPEILESHRETFCKKTPLKMQGQTPTKHIDLDLANVDHVPSNAKLAGSSAILHAFEDNGAVIKMIIKGWSPTMRHVSRTHKVAWYWLFDRIILDSKIQIRYIDTKHQLADILTKGNFARDEWNSLL